LENKHVAVVNESSKDAMLERVDVAMIDGDVEDLTRVSKDLEAYRVSLVERRAALNAERETQGGLEVELRERRGSLDAAALELDQLELSLAARGQAYNEEQSSLGAQLEAYRAEKVRMFSRSRDELEDYRGMLEERRIELEAHYRVLSHERERLCGIQDSMRAYAAQTAAMIALLEPSGLEPAPAVASGRRVPPSALQG
jgi:chromosome segregation ATPase